MSFHLSRLASLLLFMAAFASFQACSPLPCNRASDCPQGNVCDPQTNLCTPDPIVCNLGQRQPCFVQTPADPSQACFSGSQECTPFGLWGVCKTQVSSDPACVCSADPKTPACLCASGMTSCSGSCADLLSSSLHCGTCGKACLSTERCFRGSCLPKATCPPHLLLCQGSCIQPLEDPLHCGKCNTLCAPQDTCIQGRCLPSPVCPTGLFQCSGVCVDLRKDLQNCGACGVTCPPGFACDGGLCTPPACPTKQPQRCQDLCTDLSSDPQNCGKCGDICPSSASCVEGQCRPACSAPPFALCRGNCVNTSLDPQNCGGCSKACASGATCQGGVCTCPSGQTLCDGACVDQRKDPSHCGSCKNLCAPQEACDEGVCSTTCTGRLPDRCSGLCTSVQSDPKNCGGCGKICAPDQVCSQGLCRCPIDRLFCNGRCIDPKLSNEHCGSCNARCSAGTLCTEGSCKNLCTTGTTACLGSCVDLRTNPDHCGKCSISCNQAVGLSCLQGQCRCSSPQQTLCGGLCVDLYQDPHNCGSCNKFCTLQEICSGGRCTPSCSGTTPDLCNGACVDLQSNSKNCGICGSSCAAGQACFQGVCRPSCPVSTPFRCADGRCAASFSDCACPPNQAFCTNRCVELSSDPQHCGTCGTLCPSGASCKQGICLNSNGCPSLSPIRCADNRCVKSQTECSACVYGKSLCSGVCTALLSDPKNCGACGSVCSTSSYCFQGRCTPSQNRCLPAPSCSSLPCVDTLAGLGRPGFQDGSTSQGLFQSPTSIVAIPGQAGFYIADTLNHRIRKFTSCDLSTLAGSGIAGSYDGPALQAKFSYPTGLLVHPTSGEVYIADSGNHVLRKLDAQGQIRTVIGLGRPGFQNGSATQALLNSPSGLAWTSQGEILIVDSGNHAIRKLDPQTRTLSTLAGVGQPGSQNGPGAQASFFFPTGIAVALATSEVFIADTNNHLIRRIDRFGNVTTVAGSLTPGFLNDLGSQAAFRNPTGIVFSPQTSELIVSDTGNHAIRKISSLARVSTLAGGPFPGFQDGSASQALFASPFGLFERTRSLYIVDQENHALREIRLP